MYRLDLQLLHQDGKKRCMPENLALSRKRSMVVKQRMFVIISGRHPVRASLCLAAAVILVLVAVRVVCFWILPRRMRIGMLAVRLVLIPLTRGFKGDTSPLKENHAQKG